MPRGPSSQAVSNVWTKPSLQKLKCNMDETLFKEVSHIGYGFLLRDENYDLIVAKVGRLNGILDPLEIESLTYREVLAINSSIPFFPTWV